MMTPFAFYLFGAIIFLIVILLCTSAPRKVRIDEELDYERIARAEAKRERKRKRVGGMAGSMRTDTIVTILLASLSAIALASIEPLRKPVLKDHEWTCSRYVVLPPETEPVCIQFTRKEHV